MPTPEGQITTSTIWQQEGSGFTADPGLVSDVSNLIMGGGYSNEVATDIIKLVVDFYNKEKE